MAVTDATPAVIFPNSPPPPPPRRDYAQQTLGRQGRRANDYDTELVWDDEDDDQPDSKVVKLFKIGEKTEKFLASVFATAIPNVTRRQWCDKYGAPNTPGTACPNLDTEHSEI